jgi:hypothetical protein
MEDQELPSQPNESDDDESIQVPAADDDTYEAENVEDESIDPAHRSDSLEESLDPAGRSDSAAVKDSPGNWPTWHGFAN